MLLASAVDIAVGWVWHTAYRARWHWKLKREWALVAAGCVAFVGAVDTARSGGGAARAPAPNLVAALTVPATADNTLAAQILAAIPTPAPSSPAPSAPSPIQQAALADAAPQFPIIQDQTGSIDQADPVETILPLDPEAQKDDPIARKINERFGDAVEAAPKRKPVKTASAKQPAAKQPAAKTKPAKKPAATEAN